MNKTINLDKYKTGLELEVEFNRIINLALSYKMSHVLAEELLTEIYNYGLKSKLFSISDHAFYMIRKNTNNDGSARTHLEMARNIKNSQKREHTAFLYCFKWFRKKHPNEELSWMHYGSDEKGYIMIVNSKLRTVVKPDYEVARENRILLIESKTFYNPPEFKVANIIKYKKYEDEDKICYLLFRYKHKHYIVNFKGMEMLLKLPWKNKWKQNTVVMSEENIKIYLEKKYIKELVYD